MERKKILIITYYWPPSGGSGVQRWLKFVKYLRSYNLEPVVFTVDNPNYAIEDFQLEKEIPKNVTVLKKSFWEPNKFFSFFKSGKNKMASVGFLTENPSTMAKGMRYIRANYFIPDARKYWIKPSVKYLTNYLKSEDISLIITTGPPHSAHLIGMKLKDKTGIPWISDFRDPWTEIDYLQKLPLTEKSKKKHAELEEEVLKKSSAVIVIGETMKKNYDTFSDNIFVIPNGYDDTTVTQENAPTLDEKFSMAHIGLMNSDRNPKTLWKAISELCKENEDFKSDYLVQLIGTVAPEVENSISEFEIKNVSRIAYLPNDEVRVLQKKAQVLLLCINNVPSAKGIITGKIFEYLQAKRPVLATGPTDGDLANILSSTNAGTVVGFEDLDSTKRALLKLYSDFKKGSLTVDSTNIEKYHRKQLTGELAKVIEDTLS